MNERDDFPHTLAILQNVMEALVSIGDRLDTLSDDDPLRADILTQVDALCATLPKLARDPDDLRALSVHGAACTRLHELREEGLFADDKVEELVFGMDPSDLNETHQ